MSKTHLFDLDGKIAFVSGASRGIGEAIAKLLAQQGAHVIVSSRKIEGCQAVADAIIADGGKATAIACHIGEMEQIQNVFAQIREQFGQLDILVNNAAIAVQGKSVGDPALDTEGLDLQWRINVLGAVATTRAAAPRLADGGRIVFIGSGLGSRVAFAGVADYAGTKAAIVGYAKGVGRDLGPRNITVNVVQPGIMPTDMAAGAAGNLPDSIMDLHAIRRIATVEEVAAAVCFLAGPEAGYVTGGVLDVSGGFQI